MILRRLAEVFRRQDWIAVLLEVLISVAANCNWDVVAANILLAGEMEVLKTRIESELSSLRAP